MKPPIAFLALAMIAVAQEHPPDRAKPSRLEGRVTNALTGDPVSNVHVTFRVPTNDKARTFGAITTAEGKFSIVPIDPGDYRVRANRPGYFTPGQGAALKIAPGDTIEDFALKLMPEAVIGGRVVDAYGDPVEGIVVEAVRGGPRSEQETDANGGFRIAGLAAGKYLVRAVPSGWGQDREIRADGAEDRSYGLTYYPSALSEQGAAVVEARSGGELSGIVIRLARTPVVRISGALTGAPEGVRKFHFRLTEVGSAHEMGLVEPRFALWRLPRGRYSLWTMCQDPSGRTWQSAYQEFELGEVNVDNLELRLMPPFEIHGRIDWDGPAAPVGQGRKLRLQPFIKWAESESTEIDDNGTFVFAEAAPGRYEVRLAGMPENAYVKSVRQGPVEMPNRILDVRQGPSGPVAITLNPRGARISGIVSDLKGAVAEASVGLVGEEPVGFDFFRTSRTGADGAYSFHGLPPGTYRVFVFDSEDYEHLRKNRALPFYANPVEKIEVAEGDNISRDLKLDGGMRLMP